MRLFDTHAHLTDRRFDADRDELIRSFAAAGVELCVTCASDLSDAPAIADLCAQYPDVIYGAIGVHPHEAGNMTDADLTALRGWLAKPGIVALGEIGLDYHYDFTPRDVQIKRFTQQLELACELNLPVILHDREAHADMLNCLLPFAGKLRAVMHCYSGSAEMLAQYQPLDLYFGFDGPVTFKNAQKPQKAAAAVPLDRLLIETDCPYLTPEPHRGKRNDPTHVALVCRKIAELRGMDADELAETTLNNGKRLFGI